MQDVGRHHHHSRLSNSTDRLSTNWLKNNRLRLFPKDSILIPKSGASVNLNHRVKLATEAYVVSHLAVIIPDKSKIIPDYLFWWSVLYDPRAQAQVTSLPSLKLSTLRAARIRVPPIDEQQRVVEILNQAARIEQLRDRVNKNLYELVPALFFKMFENSKTRSFSWEVASLSDLCKIDCHGLSPHDSDALNLRFLGVENVNQDTGVLNFDKNSRVGAQKSTTFRFDSRHVLYAKLRPYLNKVASPNFEGRCSSELVPLLPKKGVDKTYLANLLRRKKTVDFALSTVTGSRMPRTDMKTLMSMPVPLPPLTVQEQFSSIVNKVDAQITDSESATTIGSNLTASLMDRLIDC